VIRPDEPEKFMHALIWLPGQMGYYRIVDESDNSPTSTEAD